MAFTEFYCQSGGSNLNAGSTTSNTAAFTYASGNWDGTSVFTVASGNPSSDGVVVGDFASVYVNGSTSTNYIGRVTAVDSTTITVSTTAKSGASPTSGTGNRTLKIGGAWQGPNGTSDFPLTIIREAMTNAAGDRLRVNFKNTSSYSVTAALSYNQAGTIRFQGYTTTPGDGGRFVIDGGTSGSAYALLTMSAVGGTHELFDCELKNNGATGAAIGFTNGSGNVMLRRVVVHDVRGSGFSMATAGSMIECEAYNCNQNNSANNAGFVINSSTMAIRCIAHDNSGANTAGFIASSSVSPTFYGCIADSNGGVGFRTNVSAAVIRMINCDAYNNTSHGVSLETGSGNDATFYLENCNFIKNGGYGVSGSGTTSQRAGVMVNCAFGAGSQANTSGTVSGVEIEEIGTVTYASNATPYTDAANGDFSITLAAAKNAGRGAFLTTQSSYGSTVGYPDIGAAQANASASGGLRRQNWQGGYTG